jgi:4'-phosphopantetheinyl transferase EntD
LRLDLFPAEVTAGRRLARPIRLAGAVRALEPAQLTPGELARWRALPRGPRGGEWLRGRAALRRLLTRLHEPADTAELTFPDRRLSLTHSSRTAVAAWAGGGRPDGRAVLGVGVDLEADRTGLDPRAGRLFLSPRERAWVASLEESVQADARLRLWVIKEALFKANPANHGTTVAHYSIAEPGARCSEGSGPCPAQSTLRYAALRVADGHLAVAVCLGRLPCP